MHEGGWEIPTDNLLNLQQKKTSKYVVSRQNRRGKGGQHVVESAGQVYSAGSAIWDRRKKAAGLRRQISLGGQVRILPFLISSEQHPPIMLRSTLCVTTM